MKILKLGRLPEEVVYQSTCGHCHTTFEYLRKETRTSYDQRDGNLMVIPCPLCNKDVYKSP